MGVTIHILSNRRLPISNSPAAAVPLLPRSGFVQCAQKELLAEIKVYIDGISAKFG
jgi:hypothetical protein